MTESILDSTKKVLGIAADYTEFDLDILMNINGVLSTLTQLGIGPVDGFTIEDNVPTWDAFLLGDNRLNFVKTYVHLKVRLVFDPPTTAHMINAMQEQVKELEWRINVVRENILYNLGVV